MPEVLPKKDLMPIAYVGISGVLHPSESLYRLVRGRSPWTNGHTKYESAPVLEAALARWPEVKLVITSTQPVAHGLDSVLGAIGATLAARVVGCTFEDLTTKATRDVLTRDGLAQIAGYSAADYWRMNKADIVAAHVRWRRPNRWIAIDDEGILWAPDVRRDRLVLTDGCEGLMDQKARDRLQTVLLENFGR